jgi:hypothetical protein
VLFTFSWLLNEMDCNVVIVTDGMTDAELDEVHLGHASSTQLQQAFDEVLASFGSGALVGVMPYAGLVLPTLPQTQV